MGTHARVGSRPLCPVDADLEAPTRAVPQVFGATRSFQDSVVDSVTERLEQLNLPQHSLDTAQGMESSVSHLNEARTGRFLFASWVRRLIATGDVIYAGAYSTIRLPGYDDPCVKVTFPLPNGNAIVVMRPQLTESK
jgi:hypothetical protein